MSVPVGRLNTCDQTEAEQHTLCSICLSNYGPGKEHTCTKGKRQENINNIVRSCSPKSKEHVVSTQLKEIFEDKKTSTEGGKILLSTGGPPIQATLGIATKPQPLFTSEELNRQQTKLSLSDNKMKIAGNFLHIKCGKKYVVNLKKYMTERNKIFAEDFEHKVIKQRIYKKDGNETETSNKRKKELLKFIKILYWLRM